MRVLGHRHSRESGNPYGNGNTNSVWIPACAGMTIYDSFRNDNGFTCFNPEKRLKS